METEWCCFSGEYAAKLCPFISADESRYYLHGISVEPVKGGGCVLAATNGQTLGAFYDKSASASGKMIVNVKDDLFERGPDFDEDGNPVAQSIIEGDNMRVVCQNELTASFFGAWELLDGDVVKLQEAHKILPYGLIHGTFPDWRKAMPFNEAAFGEPFGYAATKLRKIDRSSNIRSFNIDLLNHFRRLKGSATLFHAERQELATIIRFETEPDFIGMIAPAASDVEAKIPDWIEPI